MTAEGPGIHLTPPPLADRLAQGLLPAAARAPRILDPACGEGELLLAGWRAAGRSTDLAGRGLFGIERDPALAARARARLAAEIGGEPGRRAAGHVLTADALDPALSWPEGTCVIANPPWVSLSGRQRVALPAGERERILTAWPATARWPSLHGAFLERIARHVQAGRTGAACLLPSSVAELDGYAELRRTVTAHATLREAPEELDPEAFPAVCEPGLLLRLRGRARVLAGDSGTWWQVWTESERSFVDRLRSFPTLPAGCFRDHGVHTGNSRRELLVPDPPPGMARVRAGRDLAPFRLGPPRLGLRTDLIRTPERRFRIAARERYRSVPVLVRQTASRPIAALHDAPTYFQNSLLACTPPEELDPAFAVAVLNTGVTAAWHRLNFPEARQRSFPQVKVAHLRSIPFPFVLRSTNPRLHDSIAAEARALSRGPSIDPVRRKTLSTLVANAFDLPCWRVR